MKTRVMAVYNCKSCSFVSKNRKNLTNHVALNHNTRVYRCTLCTFVSRFQANFRRHQRNIHKLNSANVCKTCGHLCDNWDQLVAHTSNDHPQFLNVLLRKLEPKRARHAKYTVGMDDLDGAVEGPAGAVDIKEKVLSENGVQEELAHKRRSLPSTSSTKGFTGRRTYTCAGCSFVTKWSREFLGHRRDVHGDQITIHNCPFCKHSSKYPRKLQLHCNSVHKTEMNGADPMDFLTTVVSENSPQKPGPSSGLGIRTMPKPCSGCTFQTRSRVKVKENEKSAHLKRRFYRCQQCGYMFHEKRRYTRHLRIHSLPMIKCQLCDYQTCYKWNMGRHLKYHTTDGEFGCHRCGFMTMSSKRLTAHCLRHHDENLTEISESKADKTETQQNPEDVEEDALQPPLKMMLKKIGDTAVVESTWSPMHKCRYCPQKVTWPSEMKRHEATHFKMTKKHGCPLCPIRFDNLEHLETHVMKDHQEEERSAGTSSAQVAAVRTPSAPIITDLGKSDDAQASFSGSFEALDISIKSKQILQLRKHELVQGNLKPFKCTYCSHTSRWKGDMTRHIVRMHKKGTGDSESQEGDVEQSRSSHGLQVLLSQPKNADHDCDSKPVETGVTKVTKRSASKNQDTHQSTTLSGRVVQKYKCPQCSFLTRAASQFHVHMIQHLSKRPFLCSVCNYQSNWPWDVNEHIKTKCAHDTNHKKAELVVMGETGHKNYAKYKVHLVDVEETGKGDCILQPAQSAKDAADESENIVVTADIFYRDQDPQNHGTVVAQQLLNCGHCSFSHSDRKVIVTHLGSHTGVKQYRCRLCDFASKWYHTVLLHVQHQHDTGLQDVESRVSYVEEGGTFRLAEDNDQPPVPQGMVGDAKSLKCNTCPYRCSNACHMELHMKQHVSKEGAIYKCSHCPYYVNTKRTLSHHMKLHEADGQQQPMDNMPLTTDMKKHTCDHCPYTSDNKTQYLYHKQFHRPNKNAPYKCTHCTYWSTHNHLVAQHQKIHRVGEGMPHHSADKRHLHNHLLVHKPEYAERQNGFLLAEICSRDRSEQQALTPATSTADTVDQMLLLEEAETRAFVDGGSQALEPYQCSHCPATFRRAATLDCHVKLHGSPNVHACHFCNYAVNRSANLSAHTHLHYRGAPRQKQLSKKFCCDKCPASFSHYNRFERHLTLHGRNERFCCTHCDYSVKLAINLVQHHKLHDRVPAPKAGEPVVKLVPAMPSTVTVPNVQQPTQTVQLSTLAPALDVEAKTTPGEEKRIYVCSRCPYEHHRRETVANHLRRHGAVDGSACSFCDYRAVQVSTLRDHIKCHFQPARHTKPQAFMKCNSFEICATDSGGVRSLLFRDNAATSQSMLESSMSRKFLQ